MINCNGIKLKTTFLIRFNNITIRPVHGFYWNIFLFNVCIIKRLILYIELNKRELMLCTCINKKKQRKEKQTLPYVASV